MSCNAKKWHELFCLVSRSQQLSDACRRSTPMTKEPFAVAVPEDTLVDLRERLARTRWPDEIGNDNWQYGTNLAYLKELVTYWRTAYDWRQHERTMNTFHHYRVAIAGQPIHFIHEPGRGPKPLPLILTHGWPWTFWDFHNVFNPPSAT